MYYFLSNRKHRKNKNNNIKIIIDVYIARERFQGFLMRKLLLSFDNIKDI